MYKKYVALFLVVLLMTVAWVVTMTPAAFAWGCCDRKGDVNGDGLVLCIDHPSGNSDVDYLVEYLFNGGDAPPCMGNADLNCDDSVDLGDLTMFINCCFINGASCFDWCSCS